MYFDGEKNKRKKKVDFKKVEEMPEPKKKKPLKKGATAKPMERPISTKAEGTMRLNRYIAHCGICSRRKADDYIIEGKVKVNNKVVKEPGTLWQTGDVVLLDGKKIETQKLISGETSKEDIKKIIEDCKTSLKETQFSLFEIVKELKLLGDFSDGDAIEFDTVLMTDDGTSSNIGAPYTGTKVKATYMGIEKGPKITILRYKAKSNRDRKIGHRQKYSQIKIESIA